MCVSEAVFIVYCLRQEGEQSLAFWPAKTHSSCGREGGDTAFSKPCKTHSGGIPGAVAGQCVCEAFHTALCFASGRDGAVDLTRITQTGQVVDMLAV